MKTISPVSYCLQNFLSEISTCREVLYFCGAAMSVQFKWEYYPNTKMIADLFTKTLGLPNFVGLWKLMPSMTLLTFAKDSWNGPFDEDPCWSGDTMSFCRQMARQGHLVLIEEELEASWSNWGPRRENPAPHILQRWPMDPAWCPK